MLMLIPRPADPNLGREIRKQISSFHSFSYEQPHGRRKENTFINLPALSAGTMLIFPFTFRACGPDTGHILKETLFRVINFFPLCAILFLLNLNDWRVLLVALHLFAICIFAIFASISGG